MATAKFNAFIAAGADNKLEVDAAATTVPGIGPASATALEKRSISTAGGLMGLLMTFNLDKEAFVKELVEVAKLDKKYAQEAADALYEKAMQFCSNELPPKMAADAGQTGSLATFVNGKLSTKPLAEGFVPGLGKASVKKLADKGVKTSVQLMGEFLLKGRSRTEFCKLLTSAAELRQQDLDTNDTDGAMLEKSLQWCR